MRRATRLYRLLRRILRSRSAWSPILRASEIRIRLKETLHRVLHSQDSHAWRLTCNRVCLSLTPYAFLPGHSLRSRRTACRFSRARNCCGISIMCRAERLGLGNFTRGILVFNFPWAWAFWQRSTGSVTCLCAWSGLFVWRDLGDRQLLESFLFINILTFFCWWILITRAHVFFLIFDLNRCDFITQHGLFYQNNVFLSLGVDNCLLRDDLINFCEYAAGAYLAIGFGLLVLFALIYTAILRRSFASSSWWYVHCSFSNLNYNTMELSSWIKAK